MRGMSRQPGNARRAALTAASTSAAPPRGTRAMTAPVEGSCTAPVFSRRTFTGRPSIQWLMIGGSEMLAFVAFGV